MAGYDNGWDVAFEGEDSVTLTSANHRTTAVVRQDTSGWGGQWGQICPFDKWTVEKGSRLNISLRFLGWVVPDVTTGRNGQ